MTDIESEMRQLRDIEEIKQLKARYFRFLDTKDWEAWRAIFTEDLEFIFTESNLALDRSSLDITVASEGQVHRGRDSFVEWTIATSDPITTVHGGHDPEITITGPDTATGIWGMTDYLEWPSDGPPRGCEATGTTTKTTCAQLTVGASNVSCSAASALTPSRAGSHPTT